jgi:plasmid stability protein
LKDAFAEKGFDWSRSLEDNVRELLSAALKSKTTTLLIKPASNGGRFPTVGNEPIEKHKDVVMSENADMGDIVKAAMKDARA